MNREEELHLLLSQVIRLYNTRTFALCEGLGVHPGQIPLLLTLQERDGVCQRELVQALFVRPPTVTVMLQRMARTGLIERRRDPQDRRVTKIYLTGQGRAVIQQLWGAVHSVEESAFAGFDAAELLAMRGLLKKIKGNLTQSCPAAPGSGENNL